MIAKLYPVEPGSFSRLDIILVGCGGTGSFAALHLARLAYVLKQKRTKVNFRFVDFDTVELKNVGRQNFVPAEIGQAKAAALARRYSAAFGLAIRFDVCGFAELDCLPLWSAYGGLCVVVGCTDSPAARREIAEGLPDSDPRVWWIDAGNLKDGGEIKVGNSRRQKPLINVSGFCTELPFPHIQEPEILVDQPEPAPLSCADLLALDAQGLMINQAMAGWLAVYVSRLTLTRDLNFMRTYVNLESGSARSDGISGQREQLQHSRKRQPSRGRDDGRLSDEDILEVVARSCPGCEQRLVEGHIDDEAVYYCADTARCGFVITEAMAAERVAQLEESEGVMMV